MRECESESGSPFRMSCEEHQSAGHTAAVHDIAVDPTGKYLATCSSDRSVRVFRRSDADQSRIAPSQQQQQRRQQAPQEQQRLSVMAGASSGTGLPSTAAGGGNAPLASGSWSLIAKTSVNSAPVLKVAWAHPFFGTVLATASMDRRIHVYSLTNDRTGPRLAQVYVSQDNEKDTVFDLAFAPPNRGLLLASACADGFIRIHNVSASVRLCRVSPLAVEGAPPTATSSGSSVEPIVTGAAAAAPRRSVAGSAFAAGASSSFAPSGSGTPVTGGVTAAAASASTVETPSPPAPTIGVRCASWCPCVSDLLLASGSQNGAIRIHRATLAADGKTCALTPVECFAAASPGGLSPAPLDLSLATPPTSVAWAPAMGRRRHLVAFCSAGAIVVLRLSPLLLADTPPVVGGGVGASTAFLCEVAVLAADGAVKVAWNAGGTVLASSGRVHGSLRLYQQSTTGDSFEWCRVSSAAGGC